MLCAQLRLWISAAYDIMQHWDHVKQEEDGERHRKVTARRQYPKDPAVLKIPTRGKLTIARACSMNSAGHSRVPKSEGYLNRSFPGVKKWGTQGEVKRGEVVGD